MRLTFNCIFRPVFALCLALPGTALAEPPLKVAVYSGAGASNNLKEVVKALESDARLTVTKVTPEEIRADVLKGMDVIVLPGGSSSTQGIALGEDGRTKIRDF